MQQHYSWTLFFVVAKGGSASGGGIIYSVILRYTSAFLGMYFFCLDIIRVAAFDWLGMPAQHLPKEYDELLKDTHATDLYSFCTY